MKLATLCVSLVCAVLLSSPVLAGSVPASLERPPFAGTAHPVIPATQCLNLLPPAKRLPNGAYADPFYPGGTNNAAFKLSNCWRGVLRGRPFVLEGFYSGPVTYLSGVVLKYAGRLSYFSLVAGTPTLSRFTLGYVCYEPNAAKGMVDTLDIARGVYVPPNDKGKPICPSMSEYKPFPRFVAGLEQNYRIRRGERIAQDGTVSPAGQ